jgi:hypothetical protein
MTHPFYVVEDVESANDVPPHLHLLRANPADNWDLMDDQAEYMSRQLDAVDLVLEDSEDHLRTYHEGH